MVKELQNLFQYP